MEIIITLQLPIHFRHACQTMSIPTDQVLQRFIDHIYVYAHLSTVRPEPEYLATYVFNCYLKSLGRPRELNHHVKRELGIHYTKKVIQLIFSKLDPNEKEEAYQDLIDQWYRTLRKIDKP